MTLLAADPVAVIRYPRPGQTIGRFVARGATRTSAIWGVVLGLYVYASATGFTALAPTAAARQSLLDSLTANSGLKALLGDTGPITSAAGFVDWRVLGVMPLLTAVWGLLAATKAMRGEESAGRWELFLSGQTTARRATAGCLVGLAAGIATMWAIVWVATYLVGTGQPGGFTVAAALLFATTAVASVAIFVAVGALASQLMPTRSHAAALAAGVFGVSFMLRALGDAAPEVHWLVYLSPLGWIEQVHPLTGGHPLWLLPVALLVTAVIAATLLLADRDLGASTFADRDTSEPRLRLLGHPILLAFRLTRATLAGWLAVAVVAPWLYGSVAKSAGDTFAKSAVLRKFTGALTGSAQHLGTQAYAGIVFLMIMTLLMAYAASAASKIREQEEHGYLDNLVVRSVSRQGWLTAQVSLAVLVIVSAGLLSSLAFWAGQAPQRAGLRLGELAARRPQRRRSPAAAARLRGAGLRLLATADGAGRVLHVGVGVPAAAARLGHQDQPLGHGHVAPQPRHPRASGQPELGRRGQIRRAGDPPGSRRRLALRASGPRHRVADES